MFLWCSKFEKLQDFFPFYRRHKIISKDTHEILLTKSRKPSMLSIGQLEPLDEKVSGSNLPKYTFKTEIMYLNIISWLSLKLPLKILLDLKLSPNLPSNLSTNLSPNLSPNLFPNLSPDLSPNLSPNLSSKLSPNLS